MQAAGRNPGIAVVEEIPFPDCDVLHPGYVFCIFASV